MGKGFVLGLLTAGALMATARVAAAEEGEATYPVPSAPLHFADAPATPTAAKQSRQVRFDERPFAIVSILGFASPVGLAGAGAQYSLAEAVTVGAAVGVNNVGPQFAGYVNLRPLHWSTSKVAIGVGPQIAYAAGPYVGFEVPIPGAHGESSPSSYPPHDAQWIQLDLGVEVQSKSGFVFRFSHGAARMLNPRGECGTAGGFCDYANGRSDDDLLFTTSLTLGYAFGAG